MGDSSMYDNWYPGQLDWLGRPIPDPNEVTPLDKAAGPIDYSRVNPDTGYRTLADEISTTRGMLGRTGDLAIDNDTQKRYDILSNPNIKSIRPDPSENGASIVIYKDGTQQKLGQNDGGYYLYLNSPDLKNVQKIDGMTGFNTLTYADGTTVQAQNPTQEGTSGNFFESGNWLPYAAAAVATYGAGAAYGAGAGAAEAAVGGTGGLTAAEAAELAALGGTTADIGVPAGYSIGAGVSGAGGAAEIAGLGASTADIGVPAGYGAGGAGTGAAGAGFGGLTAAEEAELAGLGLSTTGINGTLTPAELAALNGAGVATGGIPINNTGAPITNPYNPGGSLNPGGSSGGGSGGGNPGGGGGNGTGEFDWTKLLTNLGLIGANAGLQAWSAKDAADAAEAAANNNREWWKANAFPNQELIDAKRASASSDLATRISESERSFSEEAAKRGLRGGSLSGGLSNIERGADRDYAKLANDLIQFQNTPLFTPTGAAMAPVSQTVGGNMANLGAGLTGMYYGNQQQQALNQQNQDYYTQLLALYKGGM